MRTIEVVAAVIRKEERIFITQRGYGDLKGMWEFPGGKIEAGETREEALRREIMEELATEIGIENHICTIEHDYESFHLVMHCYLCHIINGALQLLEHEDARWVERKELDEVSFLPADIKVLEEVKRLIL